MAARWISWLARLAWLGLLVAVFVASAYFAFNLFVRRGVIRVPDLAGQTEEEASALASDAGLAVRRVAGSGRFDDVVPPGRVLGHRPAAGSLVKRGATIDLILSLGPQVARVPDLTGQAVTAAQVTLGVAGLAVGATLRVAGVATAAGNVVAQSPAPGTPLANGSAVDLLVAGDLGPDRYVMPDLVNRRLEPVQRRLEGAGFRFGSVAFGPYEGLAPGVVLRQDPPAGHPLSRRRAISLVVSGPGGGA